VPSGKYLWIFVYSAGDYYVQGAPTSLPANNWYLSGVTLGSNATGDINAPYEIYAVLADAQANSIIKDDLNRTGGNTGTPAIPGADGVQKAANITVIRTS
jgi:hypothetical protein